MLYEALDVGDGGRKPSTYFTTHISGWSRLIFSQQFLGLLGLWCIKFAFLTFFRRLGNNVRGQKIVWRTVFGFTVGGLAISIGVIYYRCLFAPRGSPTSLTSIVTLRTIY